MARELDPGTRAISPQEPDAQPSAHAGGSRPTSRAGSSRCPANGPSRSTCSPLDSKEVKDAVDELVKLYVSKSGSFKTADGKSVAKSLSEVDDFVDQGRSSPTTSCYLGEQTISRLGCFGCHTIPGFENAKPIGTALNDWGIKNPARLDFGHIAEYLADQPPDEKGARDGTDPFYQEKIHHETRMGFLYQKLHRPRSYDYKKKSEKYKAWDDRLRMPQFAWANDPKAIEEVMTFVLGLTGEKVNAKYLPATHTTPAKTAVAEGAKVLNRFNCDGCHVLEMPKFTIPDGDHRWPRRCPISRATCRSSYTAAKQRLSCRARSRAQATIPRRSSMPNEIEEELGSARTTAKRSRSRECRSGCSKTS